MFYVEHEAVAHDDRTVVGSGGPIATTSQVLSFRPHAPILAQPYTEITIQAGRQCTLLVPFSYVDVAWLLRQYARSCQPVSFLPGNLESLRANLSERDKLAEQRLNGGDAWN